MTPVLQRWSPVALLAAALLATALVYWPGLSGPFLFDDFANLPALSEFGRLDAWDRILRYLTSGTADPLGRPLALASFLADASSWPDSPYAFKRNNLLIHLANGVLLYLLLLRLERALRAGAPSADMLTARLIAALAAAAWLLHPLLVSTTLYIIQREAMLAATCTMLGLHLFLAGRARIVEGQLRSGTLLVVAGIAGGTLLSMLCKANGVLLPLLAAALEVTVLRDRVALAEAARIRLQWLRWILLYLPSAVLVLLLLLSIPHYAGIADTYRSWSLGERLLTQPRVLLDYLRLLLLPQAYTPGLLNDAIRVSSGPFSPWTTLPALLGVLALIGVAFWRRAQWPRCAAAVLFFFAAHLIESTVVPLEMYFEHRNYLPALLLFWPLAALAAAAGERRSSRLAIALVVLAVLGGMTRLHAVLWSDGARQAAVWASMMPASPRAQANAAQFEIARGRPDLAEQRVRAALRVNPGEPQLALNLIGARCALGTLDDSDVALAADAVSKAPRTTELVSRWAADYLEGSAACARFTGAHLGRLVEAARANPKQAAAPDQKQILQSIEARLLLLEKRGEEARAAFDRAVDLLPGPGIVLRQSALLASGGFPCEGLRHLDRFESLRERVAAPPLGMGRLHAYVLRSQGYWENEFAHLRGVIVDDVKAAGQDPARCTALP